LSKKQRKSFGEKILENNFSEKKSKTQFFADFQKKILYSSPPVFSFFYIFEGKKIIIAKKN